MRINLDENCFIQLSVVKTEKFILSERSDGALFIRPKGNNNSIHISTMSDNEIVINTPE